MTTVTDKSNGVEAVQATDVLQIMQNEVAVWCEAKGWANDGRTYGDEMALLHSEVSESLEAYRAHGFEDFTSAGDPPKPEGAASELADLLVRILDTCGRHGFDLFAEWRRKMDYNWTRTHRHGGKRL